MNLISQATGLAPALILYWQTLGVEWHEPDHQGDIAARTGQEGSAVLSLA